MTTLQRRIPLSLPEPKPIAKAAEQPTLLRRIAIINLIGMLILQPVQFVTLPMNFAPVEVWNIAFMPFAWLYLIEVRFPARIPYAGAMWLILLGSFIGALSAPIPMSSIIAIIKDTYLYVWFATVVAVLATLTPKEFRRVMLVWIAVLMAHGALIIAQFVSSDIFETVKALTAPLGPLDQWRPSGLFENANSTALFQLMGFVPLFVARLSPKIAWPLGVFLLASIVATGSMASLLGFTVGTMVALGGLVFLVGAVQQVSQILVRAGLIVLLLGGAFVVALNTSPAFAQRFNFVLASRAVGSADSRFSLWERASEVLESGDVWGIGPDAYKDIDFIQKPLHNDLLAFLVERGVIGLLGLTLLVLTGVFRAVFLLKRETSPSGIYGLAAVIFLAALAAATVHGQFHQIFHHRAVWLMLAVLEALIISASIPKTKASPSGEMRAPRTRSPHESVMPPSLSAKASETHYAR